jgi:hypothetical protein
MPRWFHLAIDLVAISVLVFGIYFPRYRRRDLLVSYLAVNVGVMAVVVALTSSMVDVGVGVGFGLFGVLSIVRLRSAELAQQEVAYYFAALALGLLGGIMVTPDWLAPALSVAIVAAMALGDHPRLYGRYRYQVLTIDRAITDEHELIAHIEQLLRAQVRHIEVQKVDLVNDLTVVDVRYRLPGDGTIARRLGAPEAELVASDGAAR